MPLCTPLRHMGCGGIDPLFHDLGTVRRCSQLHAMAAVLLGKGSQVHIEWGLDGSQSRSRCFEEVKNPFPYVVAKSLCKKNTGNVRIK